MNFWAKIAFKDEIKKNKKVKFKIFIVSGKWVKKGNVRVILISLSDSLEKLIVFLQIKNIVLTQVMDSLGTSNSNLLIG